MLYQTMHQDIAAQPLPIDLRADAVVAPVMIAASQSLHILGVALPALAAARAVDAPRIEGALVDFRVPINGLDERVLRAGHVVWLVRSGFHSLAKGLRFTMERALVWCRIITELGNPIALAEFNASARQMELHAEAMRSDRLARELNRLLTEPMGLGDHLKSLTQVRNCLEHRDGRVGSADLGEDGLLHLTLPYMRVFAEIDGREVDLVPGFVAHQEIAVQLRLTIRSRTYSLGDLIDFSPAEFAEIAQGCVLLGNDIVTKLPMRPVP